MKFFSRAAFPRRSLARRQVSRSHALTLSRSSVPPIQRSAFRLPVALPLRRSALALFLLLSIALDAQNSHALDAPNPPGMPSVWAPGSKDFIGTSASRLSKVYFTGAHGMLTDVFYDSPDTVQNIDMEFLVEDAGKTMGPADGE